MPTSPEPSRVTGYIWLRDPVTERKYIAEDHLGNTAGGPFGLRVVFGTPAGGVVTVPIGEERVGGDALNVMLDRVYDPRAGTGGRRAAYHYEVRFRHVVGYLSEPTWTLNGGIQQFAFGHYEDANGITQVFAPQTRYHFWEITYDPNAYQFRTVEATSFRFLDDNSGERLDVRLNKLDSPEHPPSTDFQNDYLSSLRRSIPPYVRLS